MSDTPKTFDIGVGDLFPSIRAVLHDTDPATGLSRVMDLTGCTVRFNLRARGAAEAAVDQPATIIDTTGGVVEYEWQPGDTDTPGDYLRRWRGLTASGKPFSVPNSQEGHPVRISPQIA
jgi:hypothetical protein